MRIPCLFTKEHMTELARNNGWLQSTLKQLLTAPRILYSQYNEVWDRLKTTQKAYDYDSSVMTRSCNYHLPHNETATPPSHLSVWGLPALHDSASEDLQDSSLGTNMILSTNQHHVKTSISSHDNRCNLRNHSDSDLGATIGSKAKKCALAGRIAEAFVDERSTDDSLAYKPQPTSMVVLRDIQA